MEGARIYAQNAIREKNQSLNFLRLGSRVDAVAARLESAIRMQVRSHLVINCKFLISMLSNRLVSCIFSVSLSISWCICAVKSPRVKYCEYLSSTSTLIKLKLLQQEVSKAMGQTVNGMASAMKGMQVDQIAKTMSDFEKQFEDMDVTSGKFVINDWMLTDSPCSRISVSFLWTNIKMLLNQLLIFSFMTWFLLNRIYGGCDGGYH